MEIRGGTALVTGASRLGRAVARRLRDEGCSLTVAGDVVEPIAQEVDGRGVVADLASLADLRRVVDIAGDVDILVVGSEAAGTGSLTGHSLDELDQVLDVNLRAPIALTRLVGERMIAKGAGHIVFLSSLGGKTAEPGSSLHSATRFGLRGFALALRQDWAPLGVGVSCVNVGAVGDDAVPNGVALPAGFRPKSPDDVAAAVVRAIRHDRAEVDVADPLRRARAVFGQLAPQAAARLTRFAASDPAGER
jgi:NAD(P)-dependent dehydrogenase (short-subunit alcohol dehydrogenase family)